ncbi:MAG: YdhR family protein, partial [Acidimicrobiales bacterium]
MYVQVITFNLDGINEDAYLDVAHQLAPRTADRPGLLAKIWLENEGGNRYGGIYFWVDLESMERFVNSDLFEGNAPEFTNISVEEFGILDNLTALTQPMLEIVEPRLLRSARPPIAVPPAPTASRTTASAPRKR